MSDSDMRIMLAVAGVVLNICVIVFVFCFFIYFIWYVYHYFKSPHSKKTTLGSLRKLKNSPLRPTREKHSQNYDIESNGDSSNNLHDGTYVSSNSSDKLSDADMMTSPRINAILDQVMETSSKLLRNMSTPQEDHAYEQVPLNAPSKDF